MNPDDIKWDVEKLEQLLREWRHSVDSGGYMTTSHPLWSSATINDDGSVEKQFNPPQEFNSTYPIITLPTGSRIDLTAVDCVVYNQNGDRIFEENMPVVECKKIFKDLFDHVEVMGDSSFKVW